MQVACYDQPCSTRCVSHLVCEGVTGPEELPTTRHFLQDILCQWVVGGPGALRQPIVGVVGLRASSLRDKSMSNVDLEPGNSGHHQDKGIFQARSQCRIAV
jgi:hypothetical protein